MKKINIVWALLISLVFSFSHSLVAAERVQYRATGASSEYEAIKVAYKEILGKALKLHVGNTSGSFDNALRHKLNRNVEEEFVKTKQQFIQSSQERCTRSGVTVSCNVVAAVKMEEVLAWLNQNMGDSGSNGNRLKNAKFGIMANAGDENSKQYMKDFVAWLHTDLEHTFGNDVYLIEEYLDPKILRNQCAGFNEGYQKYTKLGASYAKSAKTYKRHYDDCMVIVEANLDAILVIESLEATVQQHDGRKVAGSFIPRISFIQTRTKRRLAAPKPKQITQYGYGSKTSAEADFRNNIYQTTTSYITQQFNDIVITALGKDRIASEKTSFEYTVTITGVNTDDLAGKKKLRFIRKWFKNTMSVDLQRDYQRSSHSEKVNTITSDKALALHLIEEDLPLDLDDEGYPARIDIAKDGNIVIAFRGEDAASGDKALVRLNHKNLVKWLKIGGTEMSLRREDGSGTPIALNEAAVSVSNNTRKNILVEVKPTWTDAGGLLQTIPFSDDKQFLIKAKSSVSLVYRAPNRQADYVSLEFTCPAGRCDVK